MNPMKERFQPFEHSPPEGFWGKIRFQLRLLLDFQVRTVYGEIKEILPKIEGKVLDIGCGQSPYKHLIDPSIAQYLGLDADTSSNFGYGDTQVLRFDGEHIPFEDGSIDFILCTEVLEHVKNPKPLIDEAFRVLKPGKAAIITVPWSARMHYLPYDYHRFSSFVLKEMFRDFSCTITPRGTDITVIVSKIIIVYMRNFRVTGNIFLNVFHFLLILFFFPFIILCVLIGHLTLLCRWGSPDDPLGWTIYLKKG